MTCGLIRRVSVAALGLALAAFATSQAAQAQGSMGGSIGVQEKSVSGDRDAPKASPKAAPPAARQRSAPEPRRAAPEPKRAAPRKGGGGGGANYDGVWFVNNIGCGGSAGRVVVSGGRISGDGGVTGSVSANGTVRTSTAVSVGWGRVSGNRGSGGFRTNDGCTGRWTSSR
jgi:hypothetical protein